MTDLHTIGDTDTFVDAQSRVFFSLLQQIKTPFLHIRHEAELGHALQDPERFQQVQITADAALGLLDSYMLSLQLQTTGPELQLEPVALSSVLNEAAHALQLTARAYDTDIQLVLDGKYEPVIAHKAGLFAALTSLGYVLLQTPSAGARKTIELSAHRSRGGIVAGLYANGMGLEAGLLKKARSIPTARQPFGNVANIGGAGVFIAEALLESMQSRLRIARHHNMRGLAATFVPSQQMSLV